ncbi:Las1-domain-containing protein [Xylariaceae sp. FL0016]|nr:Las1-domain-containing protein [Xylariaceae sp. FL0016]
MVQYVHTPWRDRAELLRVRRQFYDDQGDDATGITHDGDREVENRKVMMEEDDEEDEAQMHMQKQRKRRRKQERQSAVARVAVWMQRGGCPHLVESTALLTAAVLSDGDEEGGERETRWAVGVSSDAYAARAAYSAAFSRFVTGLLDNQQDKARKMSMYSVAKTIGLPATFVELRHQATHEQLPSLSRLRSAAQKALLWIWDYYWKDLAPIINESGGDGGDPCRAFLMGYLRGDMVSDQDLRRQLRQWDETTTLRALAEIGQSAGEPKLILRSLQLSQGILDGSFSALATKSDADIHTVVKSDMGTLKAELQTLNEELASTAVENTEEAVQLPREAPAQTTGWSRYQGVWKPKPIGVV